MKMFKHKKTKRDFFICLEELVNEFCEKNSFSTPRISEKEKRLRLKWKNGDDVLLSSNEEGPFTPLIKPYPQIPGKYCSSKSLTYILEGILNEEQVKLIAELQLIQDYVENKDPMTSVRRGLVPSGYEKREIKRKDNHHYWFLTSPRNVD